MRAAPPTTWPLARQGFWRLAHATVPALAGASWAGHWHLGRCRQPSAQRRWRPSWPTGCGSVGNPPC